MYSLVSLGFTVVLQYSYAFRQWVVLQWCIRCNATLNVCSMRIVLHRYGFMQVCCLHVHYYLCTIAGYYGPYIELLHLWYIPLVLFEICSTDVLRIATGYGAQTLLMVSCLQFTYVSMGLMIGWLVICCSKCTSWMLLLSDITQHLKWCTMDQVSYVPFVLDYGSMLLFCRQWYFG